MLARTTNDNAYVAPLPLLTPSAPSTAAPGATCRPCSYHLTKGAAFHDAAAARWHMLNALMRNRNPWLLALFCLGLGEYDSERSSYDTHV
jgi:hypothetical protein